MVKVNTSSKFYENLTSQINFSDGIGYHLNVHIRKVEAQVNC